MLVVLLLAWLASVPGIRPSIHPLIVIVIASIAVGWLFFAQCSFRGARCRAVVVVCRLSLSLSLVGPLQG